MSFSISSCQKSVADDNNFVSRSSINTFVEQPKLIPLENALASLNDFLSETEDLMPDTRSGNRRVIASVDKYYMKGVPTRSSDALPDAYIVNFEDDEGFAVLGAQDWQDEIIAVTESGSIDPTTLAVAPPRVYMPDPDDDAELEGFDWYCEEDDDYYNVDSDPTILTQLIGKTIMDDGGMTHTAFATRAPILQTNWGQGTWKQQGLYNHFCYKYKNSKQVFVLAGCSTAAMAMIVASNQFPDSLIVNGTLIDYSSINSTSSPVTPEDTLHTNLLYGAIFKDINYAFASKWGTCITPTKVKKRFEDFDYSNVKMLTSSNEYSDEMIIATSNMLYLGRPVFISAIPEGINGHSWVIDGAKYHNDDTYLVHCNWGWGGSCNGYFSSRMLNPSDPVETDDPNNVSDGYSQYTWHFRLITYSCGPSSNLTLSTL